jgi:vancomycin resistance protein YoaR
MTTLTALSRPRLLLAAGPMRRGFLIGFLITLAVGLMLLVGASVGVGISHADRVMPGVSVAGVPLGGMDRASAVGQLAAQLPSPTAGTLVLSVDGERLEVPFAGLGRSYDFDGTVDAALGVARTGNPLTDGIDRLRVLTRATPLSGGIVVQDPARLDALVASVTGRFEHEPIDATVSYDAATGFEATPAVVGLTVDTDALRKSLGLILASPSGADGALQVAVVRAVPAVSTEVAAAAAAGARLISDTPLKLTGGGKKLALDQESLAGLITFGSADGAEWGAVVDRAALSDLLKPLARQVSSKPSNASFTFGPNGVSGVLASQPGRRLKLAPTLAAVLAALEQRAAGSVTPSAALSVGVAQPLLTTREARAVAPKLQKLSSWTTDFIPGEGNFWGANITIPARDLDGTVLAPGEWFDFWRDLPTITVAHGYGYGGAIIGGRSIANGALAGGICSTSTTLFNAAMRAGLEIGDKTNHFYYIDRYPTGLDATVFQTDAYEVNMTFRNDTKNPIVVRAYTGSSFVRFDIWGVPDGRTVRLSAPTTSNHRSARETTVFNPNLAPGTAVRREYMHDGFDAVVSRWVSDRDGNIIHEDTWHSHYSVVNGITEVGPRRTSD